MPSPNLTHIDCGPCILRPWQRGDAKDLQRHANNRDVWLNLRDRFPHPYTLRDARAWIAHASPCDPIRHFGIEVDGEIAGGIGIEPGSDIERCSAEVGYWLGAAFWGRGIATAALTATTQYAFDALPLARVFAVPFLRNPASLRVLEKAGYVREGIMKRSAIKDGVVLDQALYACVR